MDRKTASMFEDDEDGFDAYDPLDDVRARARKSDPETSKEAAAKLNADECARLNQRDEHVMCGLAPLGDHGATTFELTPILEVPRENFSSRMSGLEKRGLVKRVGKRLTPSTNCYSTVWAVTEAGKRAAEQAVS